MKNTITTTAIDFIGDIHGHAKELENLLEKKLGYINTNGFYQHPTRKAFFVGDFIDRGPDIKGVLEIVKPMIENGAAYTVLGNHEYNAICYWTNDTKGNPLRAHSEKNSAQHIKTIESVGETGLLQYVEWFKTLPIYFENDAFRVVHAQWNQQYVDSYKKLGIANFSDAEFMLTSIDKSSHDYVMIDCLLKGQEVHLPEVSFQDKDGNSRNAFRIKWWKIGSHLKYSDALFEFPDGNTGTLAGAFSGYGKTEPPVFFGHYWLKNNRPLLQQSNVCCLDFSVAKGGILVAYKWDGEHELKEEKFEYV